MMEHDLEKMQRIQLLMMSVRRKQRPIFHKAIQPFNVTPQQYYVLKTLYNDGSARVNQLAEKMQVKPSAITIIVNKLVEQELVIREYDEEDRRAVNVYLTTSGEELVKKARRLHGELMRRYFARFSEEELETFITLYDKLDMMMQQESMD
ncbi:MarR family winged helix-turn-helix transcriptional regulator [Priestia taiwanensis]|uniref:MarR family transcriptional regulator n=1 Tax=Priestia taiwanensis TaxID=1347902 RepID=A0A917ARQ9_9BACI|nr:MarR family transcriptional regulator [Priestia taiwanensis]MBM7363285.1 DNA-binding MarR family transcriptional regulator [Priestia taiwanensis]GGE69157.1 MarR family transcriptional regulator [Priestia taiwanensis]